MKTKLLLIFTVLCTIANAQYTKLFDFAGTSNGSNPYGSLISDGIFLYGMTAGGGTYGKGVVFKIKPDGTSYSILLNFTGTTNGNNPLGSLIADGTFLYGMTQQGGTNDLGVVFKIKPDGTSYSILHDFTGTTTGSNPRGSLISDGTFLYGMTAFGGTNDLGVVFKIKPDGSSYSKLLDFTGAANGSKPRGSLISDGIFLYGMTAFGGTSGLGIVFKIKPDGTSYSKLLDFTGTTNGSYPYGSLIYDGTFLYGMTAAGGLNDKGVVFKIKPDGTSYSILLDFAGNANGRNSWGSLIADGTFLYGMTQQGGTNDYGVVFKIKPDGTSYSMLLDFAGTANGRNTWGSLITDGTFFYGMTAYGGANDVGTIFKLGMATAVDGNIEETNFSIYPNPFSLQTTLQTDKVFKETTLTVFNIYGQIVKQIKNIRGQTITLHRDNLHSGLYFIRLTEGNKVIASDKLLITD